jgi:CRISPR type III-associated protein (TIGR04423 family)
MRKNRTEVIEYINGLKGYEGYVQFSNRPIKIEEDVFMGRDPKVEEKEGFVYEAHFSNAVESIAIRQQNEAWLVSVSNIENAELETFHAIAGLKVNMAQIWVEKEDELCEGMKVKKLQKVVFAGFERGES